IAVKRFKVWSNKAEREFAVEVEILARVQHKNLLGLRGYCAEGQERYLHHQATPRIIHRDIKASNVLLDSDFQARVADFGFAKLIPDGATHVTTNVKGTLGYLAPEYAMFGKTNESCDVYSFGILLLELASGRKPIEKLSSTVKISIVDWALPLVCEKKFSELADPRLNGNYVEEELKRVIIVALVCVQDLPEKRPTMLDVVELLKGESKDKFSHIENSEMFRSPLAVEYNDGTSVAEDCLDFISGEKELKHELKEDTKL
ncbi:Serine/threonine-protein kinase, active site, partial [Sesbania bispinosa]